jgi:hypothetical protein
VAIDAGQLLGCERSIHEPLDRHLVQARWQAV